MTTRFGEFCVGIPTQYYFCIFLLIGNFIYIFHIETVNMHINKAENCVVVGFSSIYIHLKHHALVWLSALYLGQKIQILNEKVLKC